MATQELVRSAVLASLQNERRLLVEQGNEDQLSNENKANTQSCQQQGEEVREVTGGVRKRRRQKKQQPDANWKVLLTTLSQHKEARKPKQTENTSAPSRQPRDGRSGTGSVTAGGRGANGRKTAVVKATATVRTISAGRDAAAPMSVSAFMKREVRDDADVTRVVALDCEMVGVGPEGSTDSLARVSVVNYAGDVLYDTFVKPGETVTDYRTQWSGVRAADIAEDNPDAVSQRQAQDVVAGLIRGRIIVGHAIRNDLNVLRVKHPRHAVRDTAEFYKRLWRRRGNSKPALRVLVAQILGVDAFQRGEHDSREDARAALALYKHNSKKWENSIRERKKGKAPS